MKIVADKLAAYNVQRSPAENVFGIFELAESILVNLDMRQFFKAQRISSVFRQMTTMSPRFRRTMFLEHLSSRLSSEIMPNPLLKCNTRSYCSIFCPFHIWYRQSTEEYHGRPVRFLYAEECQRCFGEREYATVEDVAKNSYLCKPGSWRQTKIFDKVTLAIELNNWNKSYEEAGLVLKADATLGDLADVIMQDLRRQVGPAWWRPQTGMRQIKWTRRSDGPEHAKPRRTRRVPMMSAAFTERIVLANRKRS